MYIDDKSYLDKKYEKSKKKVLLYFFLTVLINIIVMCIYFANSEQNKQLLNIIGIIIILITNFILHHSIYIHNNINSMIEKIFIYPYFRWDGENIDGLLKFMNIRMNSKKVAKSDIDELYKKKGITLKKGDFLVKDKNDIYVMRFKD